jgi:hypothetical protein
LAELYRRAGLADFSADGRYLAFNGNASNLSPDDLDTDDDVFVRDLGAPA